MVSWPAMRAVIEAWPSALRLGASTSASSSGALLLFRSHRSFAFPACILHIFFWIPCCARLATCDVASAQPCCVQCCLEDGGSKGLTVPTVPNGKTLEKHMTSMGSADRVKKGRWSWGGRARCARNRTLRLCPPPSVLTEWSWKPPFSRGFCGRARPKFGIDVHECRQASRTSETSSRATLASTLGSRNQKAPPHPALASQLRGPVSAQRDAR